MSQWFNGRMMVGNLPSEAIADCTAQGDVSASVGFWRIRLSFEAPLELAREFLQKEVGLEVSDYDDDRIQDLIFWQACFSCKENGLFYMGP